VVSPLLKSRVEVLRLIEQLSEKQYNDVADLIIPVCSFPRQEKKREQRGQAVLVFHFISAGSGSKILLKIFFITPKI
jgi:hypothetical protein